MKKTRMLVITASIVLGLGAVVEAKLPANAIVVGNNVYDITYFTSNISKINDQVMNNLGSIFYVDSNNTTKDIFTGSTLDDAQIVSRVGNTLNYYTSNGTVKKLVADSDNEFDDTSGVVVGSLSAVLNMTYKKIIVGGQILYAYTVSVDQLYGLQDAAYFSLDNSSTVSLTQVNTYIGEPITSLKLYIYNTSQKDIASGSITGVSLNGDSGTINTTVSLHYDGTANIETGTGNSSVNIVNTGFTAVDSDNKWMYYVNTSDSNKLYKKSVSGTDDSVISDDKVGYINILGDWIYYINYSDGATIYKVRTDGTQKQQVSDDMASCLNILSGEIYYINQSDRGRIYVIDSQGTRQLCSDSANFLSAGSNNMLYYVNISDSNTLYKYLLTTDTKSKVSDVSVQFLNVLGDSSVLYAGKDGLLYVSTGSYNSNPAGMTTVTNVPSSKSNSTTLNAVNDKLTIICAEDANDIYYKSYADGGKLYKLDKKTGNGYKVLDDTVDYINIIGDYIYYLKSGKLYYVPKDSDGTVKGTAVIKPKSTLKISKIGTIDPIRTDDLSKINFPDRVAATMSDNTTVQLVVNWDKTIPKPSKGVYTFTGTILGYGNKVTIAVTLDSGVVNTDNVTVVNAAGSKDTVTVTGLTPGDVINIYNAYSDTKALKSVTAGSTGTAAATGLNLNSDGGSLYITLTKSGKSEGEKIAYVYGPEAPVNFSVNAANDKITGLKSGMSYKVYLQTPNTTTGDLPDISTASVAASGQANSSGVLSLSGVLSNMNDLKQLRIVATNNGKDSVPSAAVEVGKPTLSGVSVDLNNARLVGTTVNMQYSYAYDISNTNVSDWASCLAISTPVSMTRSLQVSVKSLANGPYLQSNVVTFGLFPTPVITGITDGGTYYIGSNLTASWPADGDNVTYKAVLYDSSGNVIADGSTNPAITNNSNSYSSNLIKLNSAGTDTDINSIIQSSVISGTGKNYKLVVTATKSVNGLIGHASTTVNFTVTSGRPQTVNIAMAEKPGTMKKDSSNVWVSIDPSNDALTYYQATPTWTDYPSTSSTAVIQRLDLESSRDLSKVDIDTIKTKRTNSVIPWNEITNNAWNNAEKVPFSPNTTITQSGYYKLTVTSAADDNKATTDTVKYFIVDADRTATLPTVTGNPTLVDNGTYSGGLTSIEIDDVTESLTIPTLIRDGYSTPFVDNSGAVINPTKPNMTSISGAITLNGTYQLYLNTVNVVNGKSAYKSYTFYVDSTQTQGPSVTFSFDGTNANKLIGAEPGMEYNIGDGWKDIQRENQQLTDDELNLINSSASIDRIMVRTKATSDQAASSATNIMLTKGSKPTGVTFSFSGTNKNKLLGFLSKAKIIGLQTGKTYTVSDDGGTTNYGVQGDGTLGVAGSQGVSLTGTEITGLTSGKTYTVTFDGNSYGVQANGTLGAVGSTGAPLMPMEYSLNGGNSWVNSSTNTSLTSNPTLTDLEINSITAANGIKVRTKATGQTKASDPMTINIINQSSVPSTTFSFDGTNANKLMGFDYTTMEYSLNGGNSWVNSSTNTSLTSNPTLTDLEINSITAANGIKVRYKASGTAMSGPIQTIDIQAGPTTALTGLSVSGSTLSGTTTAMEYSLNGTSWTSCGATTTILSSSLSSSQSVYVRTKATGVTLAGTDSNITTVTAP